MITKYGHRGRNDMDLVKCTSNIKIDIVSNDILTTVRRQNNARLQ